MKIHTIFAILSATVTFTQNGKLIHTKTVKSNLVLVTKKLKKGKYIIKFSTKSSRYNLISHDYTTYYATYNNKKSELKILKNFPERYI